MDRLTMNTTGKTGIGLTFDLDVSCANMDTAERLQDLVVRLGQIEKAISDENGKYDLDRIHSLAEADRDGRCVMLPCKVGDTVYYTRPEYCNDGISAYVVTGIVFDNSNDAQIRTYDKHGAILYLYASFFGKTVFLTRAEAEEAIKDEVTE